MCNYVKTFEDDVHAKYMRWQGQTKYSLNVIASNAAVASLTENFLKLDKMHLPRAHHGLGKGKRKTRGPWILTFCLTTVGASLKGSLNFDILRQIPVNFETNAPNDPKLEGQR